MTGTTRTVIYTDTDIIHLATAIDYMADQAGWAVRHTEVLTPVHVQQQAGSEATMVLTILVVYEREDA